MLAAAAPKARTEIKSESGTTQRELGQYFTRGNPFVHQAFTGWAAEAKLSQATILEPFAGANGLIDHLQGMGLCSAFKSFDVEPASPHVRVRDTLARFPRGFDVCVTNPPWLARNSATARGLAFPATEHDDLYKFALELCLRNCGYVAALVPESFIRAELFLPRLQAFISLTHGLFDDTGHPVGLALFVPGVQADATVWSGRKKVGALSEVKKLRPQPIPGGIRVRFNDPQGNVGLIALDNTREASIRFCEVSELEKYQVKHSGRHITKITVEGKKRLEDWNHVLNKLRLLSSDVLMTSYKGIRQDGLYRRRCDWRLARGIIQYVG